MHIPSDYLERIQFAQELIDKCSASMDDRRQYYNALRSYVLRGSDSGTPAHFNKIYPHIDALSSYLYAADSTRFTCHLGESVPKEEIKKVQAIQEQMQNDWEDTGADILAAQAVFWSLANNSMFLKFGWNRGHTVKLILPEDVGVLREDVPGLHNQEAFILRYTMTKSELIDKLYQHPRATEIIQKLSFTTNQPSEPTVMDRILLSATSPNIIGNAPLQSDNYSGEYTPKISEDTVSIIELYVWNSAINDYQLMTFGDPMVPIWDRPVAETGIKGNPGIVQFCPNPLPNYFWGLSEVSQLRYLQDMRNKRMGEILHLLEKQAKPPKMYFGFSGIPEEKNEALDIPNGFFYNDNPSGKVQELAPQIPSDMYQTLDMIDAMFGEASGIGSILMGEGAPGVRSASQAAQLAKLGGSRAKKRAMIIEDALDQCATIMARINQKFNDEKLYDSDGMPFIARQFTEDFTMRVDAHSNSPLFVDDSRALAFNMLKAGLITKERCIEMINPPMKQALIEDLKRQEQHAAAQQDEQGQQPPEQPNPPAHKAKH